tara:strand:- start:223 stop:456 length:234 start_codon:yes stop_codon:yes gene_type:complete
MKVGDLVELKDSVLHQSTAHMDMMDRLGRKTETKKWLGVIVSRHQNALKVHWFNRDNIAGAPPSQQYVLKVRVVSEL